MKKKKKTIIIAGIGALSITIGIYLFFGVLYICATTDNYRYAYYNGEMYEEAVFWAPVGNVVKTDRAYAASSFINPKKLKKGKTNTTIALFKNDPEILFIKVNYKSRISDSHILHKKSDKLPNVYDETAQIVLKFENKKEILVKDKEMANELKKYLKQLNEMTETEPLEQIGEKYYAKIDIYYDNYPAYKSYGNISITATGKVAIAPFERPEANNIDGYFLLPANISDYFANLLKENN